MSVLHAQSDSRYWSQAPTRDWQTPKRARPFKSEMEAGCSDEKGWEGASNHPSNHLRAHLNTGNRGSMASRFKRVIVT